MRSHDRPLYNIVYIYLTYLNVAKIISIVIRKGGVGKTTTAVNLASALQVRGYKTLLVDLDPQANATISVGINPRTLPHSINDIFKDINAKARDIIIKTDYGLSLLPANRDLSKTEAGMTATSTKALKPIIDEVMNDYDYIILDTMPSQSYLSINALVASDSVLVPMETHYLAMEGLEDAMRDISEVKEGLNTNLEIIGILPTKVQPGTNLAKAVLEEVQEKYPTLLLPIQIKLSIKIAEASLNGVPIVISDPTHQGAIDYFTLAQHIYERPQGEIKR